MHSNFHFPCSNIYFFSQSKVIRHDHLIVLVAEAVFLRLSVIEIGGNSYKTFE